ncbi:MAG: HD domain-containing protein [Candidatus Symbiodolus clandestinus]
MIHHNAAIGLPEDSLVDTAWIKPLLGHQNALEQPLTRAWFYCQKQLTQAFGAQAVDFLAHGRATVMRLAQFTLDGDCLQAALLLPWVEGGRLSLSLIAADFSPAIAQLIRGVQQLSMENPVGTVPSSAENSQLSIRRRMLLAIIRDVRCVMIKLVERLSALKGSRQQSAAIQQAIATSCQQLYVPLANCLGMVQLKWELEDLSWRSLHPQAYHQLAQLLHERRSVREQEIAFQVQQLQKLLLQAGVTATVSGRPKHLYSIWQKMQKKGKSFEQLFDVRALRIVVADIPSCYAVLSLLHAHYQSLPKEFSDYITHPKPNGYRSIHTVILDEQREPIEVQIRTTKMHQTAELGVAAHWQYKEGTPANKVEPKQRILWLRQLLSWHAVWTANTLLAESAAQSQQWIYLFSPRQDVIELPVGATPIDFAYAIHTEIGHRCIGAKVDGRMVPLTYPLQMGQQVTILTQKQACPRRDWLNSSAGFIKTRRARVKIRAWIEQQDRLQSLGEQRGALKGSSWLHKTARKSGGNGPVSAMKLPAATNQTVPEATAIGQAAVQVAGIDNLLVTFARCCHPCLGDRIQGFITQGRGVSIHRMDCFQLKELQYRLPARLIPVQWCSVSLHSNMI